MKRTRWTPNSPHTALRIALASASLLSVAAVPALAAGVAGDATTSSSSGVYVTILSPNPGTTLTGTSKIEISAYYESSYGVSSIDLFIDGRKMATQRLSSPEGRGEISFVVDASVLRGGSHSIVVRATATDEEVASARTSLSLPAAGGSELAPLATAPASALGAQASPASASDAIGAPNISIVDPSPDATVSGVVSIKVNASDPSGKSPYVSLFVDHAFKTLRNFPPYTFNWDTTRLPNGYHTIEVLGYNDAQQVGQASPLRVLVNNPGGRTFERLDLSDTPESASGAHVIRSSSPAATSPKVVSDKASKRSGIPMIARTVKKSIVGLISRADKLASVGTGSPMAEASALDDVLAAPVVPAESAQSTKSPSLKIQIRSIVKRAYTLVASNKPLIASSLGAQWNAGPAPKTQLDRMSTSATPDLESGEIPTSMSAPTVATVAARNPVAAATPIRAGHPQIASSVHAGKASVPQSTKLERIASAQVDSSAPYAPPQLVAPKVDLSRINANAVDSMPSLTGQFVSITRLSESDISRLRGEYQVVVDNRRVEMDRPLQDRGSVLFAPMRQIFESQGGALSWDQDKRQVHAISDTKDILLTIGSKHALVNQQSVRMTSAPYLYNDRTMLPLDFFKVAMDASVSYDAATGHVIIESR
jgi:hypothetical protein